MRRRDFLRCASTAALALGCRPSSRTRSQAFELDELSIADLQAAMKDGRRTAVAICEKYLERIAAMDRRGPGLRSIIETNPDALDIARTLDRERREKGPRGPLHGIPVILKDNIDTADKMMTTAGSLALAGPAPSADSWVAARLRRAGAVILGKANLSEWANFRSNNSSSGWSARGGQCRNPYVLDRNPCGSSSGSAVSVSANLTAVAIGTETDGSIVCPSNVNGIVGLKPTVGLVARTGIIPIAHSQDTAGPMARTVADVAALLSALTGIDAKDPATKAGEGKAKKDYIRFLKKDGLKGARIGVPRRLVRGSAETRAVFEKSLEAMKEQGAVIVDPAELPNARGLGRYEYPVLLHEFKADLNAYLAGRKGVPVKTLADIIAFNEKNREKEMPWFGQEIMLRAQETESLESEAYRKALAASKRLSREEGIDKVMDGHALDALVAPTGGPAWTIDLVHGDPSGSGSSQPAAVAGYPNVTVPAGFIHGLPVGISIFGRAWSEAKLIAIAYAFEQATKMRKPPTFLPSLK